MKIKVHTTFKDYRKLLLDIAYHKPIMIAIVCVGIAMIVWITGYYFHYLPVPEPEIYQYITLGLIAIVQPVVIYRTIWLNYYSSNHLREKLEIEFTSKEIKITGESFYTELTWEKIYKIKELKNWFLIYQNNLSAIIIQKKYLNKNQSDEFKSLITGLGNVPVDLKKEN